MRQAQTDIEIRTPGRGFTEIDEPVNNWLRGQQMRTGLLTLFLQHTSASLLIQENADPQVLDDLQRFLCRLVPDGDPLFLHRAEGKDDMPAHVRSTLSATQLTIPVRDGRMTLGTWQGLYLAEHRSSPHRRTIVLHLIGE